MEEKLYVAWSGAGEGGGVSAVCENYETVRSIKPEINLDVFKYVRYDYELFEKETQEYKILK